MSHTGKGSPFNKAILLIKEYEGNNTHKNKMNPKDNKFINILFIAIARSIIMLLLCIKIMPAKHAIDTKAKLLITTWEGEAMDDEFIEAIKKYQADIQSNSDYYGFNEVVDFRKVTKIKLTTQGITNIGNIASSADNAEVEIKLAFIVSSDLAYGLVRMYEAIRSFSTNATKTVKVFKNENDAFDWVQK